MPFYKCYSCMKVFSSTTTYNTVEDGGACPYCSKIVTSLNLVNAPRPLRRIGSAPSVMVTPPEDVLWQRCLAQLQLGRSICIGEQHEVSGTARRMLIKYMAQIAQLVRWLGLEVPDSEQGEVDGNDDFLRDYFNGLRGRDPGLGDVAVSAKGADLAVVCYDYNLIVGLNQYNQQTKGRLVQLGVPEPDDDNLQLWERNHRNQAMNLYAGWLITLNIRALGRPYVILVGADHIDGTKCVRFSTLQALLPGAPVAIDSTT